MRFQAFFFYYIFIYIKSSGALYWFHGCNVNVLCFNSESLFKTVENNSELDLSAVAVLTRLDIDFSQFHTKPKRN